MTASFRFFAFLRFAPSSFSPRSRRARADAPASLGSRNRVWGEPVPPIWTATPPFSVNSTAPTQPPTRTHIPQGMLRGQAGGGRRVPPAPGKEQWNSSRPPRVPGLPSFPVINGGATSQLLLKMLHPRVQASFSGPARGPDQDRWPLYHRKAQKLSARATRGATRAGARTLGRLLLPRFLPAWSFAPGRSWVCVKAASSPDAMAEYAWVRSGGSGTFLAPLPASSVYKPSTEESRPQVLISLRPGPSLPNLALLSSKFTSVCSSFQC